MPPPHDQSKLQQISPDAGRFGSNPAVVWIAFACLASCGTWAFGQDTAPRSLQGPVSQRSLSPKPTHMSSITARWPAGPHPAAPGACSPRWQLALHFPGGAGAQQPRNCGPCVCRRMCVPSTWAGLRLQLVTVLSCSRLGRDHGCPSPELFQCPALPAAKQGWGQPRDPAKFFQGAPHHERIPERQWEGQSFPGTRQGACSLLCCLGGIAGSHCLGGDAQVAGGPSLWSNA